MTETPISPYQVFTPGAPINRRDFFAGRTRQISRIQQALPSPGRHPIIFGQRGVGKTSLANLFEVLVPDSFSIKVSCDGSDIFDSIWNRVLEKATVDFKKTSMGLRPEEVEEKTSLRAFIGDVDVVRPSHVADVFQCLASHAIIIIDEFDRVNDDDAKSQMADLIKNVSDNNDKLTIVIVGVAESINTLIGEHPSVQRNLVQVELPPMNNEEILSIIRTGCDLLDLDVEEEILTEIPPLCGGYPHYAHLLGLSMARAAEIRGTKRVDGAVFQLACNLAIEDAIETYRSAFAGATRTSKASRYPQVLCACAYAKCDDQGVFRATDVAEAMSALFHEEVTIQNVVPALGEFCKQERGEVQRFPVSTKTPCFIGP